MDKKRSLLYLWILSCVHEKAELGMKFWLLFCGVPGSVPRFLGYFIWAALTEVKCHGNC